MTITERQKLIAAIWRQCERNDWSWTHFERELTLALEENDDDYVFEYRLSKPVSPGIGGDAP